MAAAGCAADMAVCPPASLHACMDACMQMPIFHLHHQSSMHFNEPTCTG